MEAKPKTIRLNVLKPFTFTYWPNEAAKAENRGAVERKFAPGFHDLAADDVIFSHKWITRDYADNCIERPEAAQVRLDKAKKLVEAFNEDKEKANAAAEAALMRTVAHRASTTKIDEEAFRKEINTPVNELRASGAGKAGADIVRPVNEMQHGLPPIGPGGPLRPGM